MSTSLGKHVTLTKPDDFGKLLEDEGIIFTTLDKAVNWARTQLHLAAGLRFGLLRDRNDVHGRGAF